MRIRCDPVSSARFLRFLSWIEYYEWLREQDWGGPDSELSGAEQYQLMVEKLSELGLPVRNPRAQ